jgi:hypothetical protein
MSHTGTRAKRYLSRFLGVQVLAAAMSHPDRSRGCLVSNELHENRMRANMSEIPDTQLYKKLVTTSYSLFHPK